MNTSPYDKSNGYETVRLINWEEPGANDFAIAEEVTLHGNHERRPDLVLYVNGIAIAVGELKNSRISIGDGTARRSPTIVLATVLNIHYWPSRSKRRATTTATMFAMRVPLWLKIGWTVWVFAWGPCLLEAIRPA